MNLAAGKVSVANASNTIGAWANCPPAFSPLTWRRPLIAVSKSLSRHIRKGASGGKIRAGFSWQCRHTGFRSMFWIGLCHKSCRILHAEQDRFRQLTLQQPCNFFSTGFIYSSRCENKLPFCQTPYLLFLRKHKKIILSEILL